MNVMAGETSHSDVDGDDDDPAAWAIRDPDDETLLFGGYGSTDIRPGEQEETLGSRSATEDLGFHMAHPILLDTTLQRLLERWWMGTTGQVYGWAPQGWRFEG